MLTGRVNTTSSRPASRTADRVTGGKNEQSESSRSVQTFTPDELLQRAIHRRAVEAVIWGMPVVNYDLMYQAMVRAKGAFNQIA
jgi:hypothetical protein